MSFRSHAEFRSTKVDSHDSARQSTRDSIGTDSLFSKNGFDACVRVVGRGEWSVVGAGAKADKPAD